MKIQYYIPYSIQKYRIIPFHSVSFGTKSSNILLIDNADNDTSNQFPTGNSTGFTTGFSGEYHDQPYVDFGFEFK